MIWEDRPELSAGGCEEGIRRTGSFVIRDSKNSTVGMILRDKALLWTLILMRLGVLALKEVL